MYACVAVLTVQPNAGDIQEALRVQVESELQMARKKIATITQNIENRALRSTAWDPSLRCSQTRL
jgi:hypothetical protein